MKILRNFCQLLTLLVTYFCQYEGINFAVALRTRFNQFCPVNVPTPNFQFNVSKLQEKSDILYLQFTSSPSICSQAQCGCVTMKLTEKYPQLTCLISEYDSTGNETVKTRMVFTASEATSYRKILTTIENDQNGENPLDVKSIHVFFTDYSTFLVIWQCDSNFNLKNMYLATYDPEMSQQTINYINSLLPQLNLINYLPSNRISKNYCKYIAAQSNGAINENVKNTWNKTSTKSFVPTDVVTTATTPTSISIFPTDNSLENFLNKPFTNTSMFLHLEDVATETTSIPETELPNVTNMTLQNFSNKTSPNTSSSEPTLSRVLFKTMSLETTTSHPTTESTFPTFSALKVTPTPKWILDFEKTITTVSPLKNNISSISTLTTPKIENVTESSTFNFASALTNIIFGNVAKANRSKINQSSAQNSNSLNETPFVPISTETTTENSAIWQTVTVKNGIPSPPGYSHSNNPSNNMDAITENPVLNSNSLNEAPFVPIPTVTTTENSAIWQTVTVKNGIPSPSASGDKGQVGLFNYSASLYNNSLTLKSPPNSQSKISFSIVFLLTQICIVFYL